MKPFLTADDTNIIDDVQQCYDFKSMVDSSDVDDMWLFLKEVGTSALVSIPLTVSKQLRSNTRGSRAISFIFNAK